MNKILKEFTKKPITILTGATHERYQSYFSDLPFEFILLDLEKWKKWDSRYAKLPSNHRIVKTLTPDINPDVILSQHKFGQYQLFAEMAKLLRVPLISMEHMLPNPLWPKKQVEQYSNMIGHTNVFLSEYSRSAWKIEKEISTIIPQCVDSELFKNSNKNRSYSVLSVVNEFDEREGPCNYSGWLETTRGIQTKLVGTSKSGISRPAKDTGELVNIYNSHYIFLNTSRNSTMPFSVFEAMACGCVVVSTATTMIPDVIKSGYNGFLYDINHPEDGREIIKKLCSTDRELLLEIGDKARQTVVEKFGKDTFLKKWTDVINECYSTPTNFFWQNVS